MATATAPAISREMIQDRLDGLTEAPKPPNGDFSKYGLKLEHLIKDLLQRTTRIDERDNEALQKAGDAIYDLVREAIVREIDERGIAR